MIKKQIGNKVSGPGERMLQFRSRETTENGEEEAAPFVTLITFFRANSNLHPRDGSPYLNPPRRFDELDSIPKDNEFFFPSLSLPLRISVSSEFTATLKD